MLAEFLLAEPWMAVSAPKTMAREDVVPWSMASTAPLAGMFFPRSGDKLDGSFQKITLPSLKQVAKFVNGR